MIPQILSAYIMRSTSCLEKKRNIRGGKEKKGSGGRQILWEGARKGGWKLGLDVERKFRKGGRKILWDGGRKGGRKLGEDVERKFSVETLLFFGCLMCAFHRVQS